MEQNAGRTSNGVPKHAVEFAKTPLLIISGLVANHLTLGRDDLAAFPRHRSRDFYSPEERALTPDYDLAGVLLVDILDRAGVQDEAAWVSFHAGPYNHPVPLSDVQRIMICDSLDGLHLPVERGGPFRTLIPGHSYNMAVKWLDRIEITRDQPDDSATRLAEARERARQFKRKQGAGHS
jgi:DMSO/TMAO reductase YedYZ molybdopterin-dependent catalytic subunit